MKELTTAMPIQIQKVSVTHDAIIDVLIARPDFTQREIAAQFGYTPSGLGIIVRSDSFKARLAQRKAELVDPIITDTLEQRLGTMAHASLDILQRKLESSDDPKLALATLEAATKARGYGAQGPVLQQTNFIVQLPGPAATSSDWASKFGQPPARSLEVVNAADTVIDAPAAVQQA